MLRGVRDMLHRYATRGPGRAATSPGDLMWGLLRATRGLGYATQDVWGMLQGV